MRRRRGRRSEDFGVEWHAFQGDQVNYTVRQPNPPIPPPPTHLSPQAINMTGSLTENFDAFTDLSCRGYLKHFLTQQFSSVCFSVTVPLSSDSFWSNLKSQFTGRSHRALFEESGDISEHVQHCKRGSLLEANRDVLRKSHTEFRVFFTRVL